MSREGSGYKQASYMRTAYATSRDWKCAAVESCTCPPKFEPSILQAAVVLHVPVITQPTHPAGGRGPACAHHNLTCLSCCRAAVVLHMPTITPPAHPAGGGGPSRALLNSTCPSSKRRGFLPQLLHKHTN